MEIKDFIGKKVCSKSSGKMFVIDRITATKIAVREENKNQYGTHVRYIWNTGTGPKDNAITRGSLIFEDESMKNPFIEAYEEYRYSDEGKMESYLEYMSSGD